MQAVIITPEKLIATPFLQVLGFGNRYRSVTDSRVNDDAISPPTVSSSKKGAEVDYFDSFW